MTEFRMPSLGADMDEGTLVQWLKAPGDRLARGDIIAVVETQKGAIEIEVFTDGTLQELRVKPGTKVPVGEVLAIVRTAEEAVPPTPVRAVAQPAAKPAPAPTAPALVTVPGGLRVTPAARALAAERALDLSSVAPGSDGVIGLREIEAAGKPAVPKPAGGINLDELRKAIAAAMARSKREIPHYYVSSNIDLTAALDGLAAHNARLAPPQRVLLAALIIKACAFALRQVSELNGHYIDDCFQPAAEIKMGIGIALRGGGLIAPALANPDALSLDAIMQRLADLVARVRGGRLRSSELMDATVTLSNLGDDSADMVMPVIYPPQVAIIGVGQVTDRAWVVDGVVLVRKIATVAVAGDHRANDGRTAARFLKHIRHALQNPEDLWPQSTSQNS
jgi:pyruvate dehydrogenase E2 component (dihydrolipoamide acetyltransferase)